jgi:hypothetical protein
MAQAVSCRPLFVATWVRSQASPCGICGEQSDTGTVFPPSFFGFPYERYTRFIYHRRYMMSETEAD